MILHDILDAIAESLQHPFFMMIFGGLLWFAVIWGKEAKKREKMNLTFWQDQNDEIIVSFIGGLIFLVWDDESIQAFFYIKQVWLGGADPETWEPVDYHFHPFMYLLVAFFFERAYTLADWIRKK